MTVIAWIGGVLGLLVVLSTLMSVVTSLVLPRLGSSRIQKYAGTGTIKVFSGISHRFDTYEERDRFLALQAPIYLIVILAIWLAALLIGFALMLWPFMKTGGFVHALTVSGSSLFTLGFATEGGRRASTARVRSSGGGVVDRRPTDRLPPGPLRCLQPARGAGHHAGQPGGITGLGS